MEEGVYMRICNNVKGETMLYFTTEIALAEKSKLGINWLVQFVHEYDGVYTTLRIYTNTDASVLIMSRQKSFLSQWNRTVMVRVCFLSWPLLKWTP